MKNNVNKGFTIIELLVSISILALILLLVIPSVQSIMNSSKKTLLEFKITEIIAAANKYANKNVNNYQKCLKGYNGYDDLEENCKLSINTLIKEGYIDYDKKISDDEYEIYDPLTNEKIKDNILICYNPISIRAEAEYKEDENFVCSTVYSGNSYVKLDNQSGVLYVPKSGEINENNKLNIKLISNSEIGSATCDFSDEYNSDIECTYNNEKTITIKPKKNEITTTNPIEIKIVPNIGGKDLAPLTYYLSIKETSLIIEGSASKCLKAGETETYNITSENAGVLSTTVLSTTSNSDIIESNIKNNKLVISSYVGNPGTATVTLTEGNAFASASIEKYVYTYEESEFPTNIDPGKITKIPLNYEGDGELEVAIIDDKKRCIQSISYDSDNKVLIIKTNNNIGEATFKITDKITDTEGCIEEEKKINVTNIHLDPTDVTLYVGGEKKYVTATSSKNLTCNSGEPQIATCTMFGNSVEITPIAVGNTKIYVKTSDNDTAIINVKVLEPTIELKYEDNTKVSIYKKDNYYLCLDNETDYDNIKLNAYYNGSEEKIKLNPEISSDWNLGGFNEFADIIPSDSRDLIFKKRDLNISAISEEESQNYNDYNSGYNLGQTSTKLVDPNNNSYVSVMSYIYKFKLLDNSANVLNDNYSVSIDQDDILTFYVKYSSTGSNNGGLDSPPTISASNSTIIESVVNEPTGNSNSTGVNIEKTVKVTIKGVKAGSTSITFSGGLCGSKTIYLTIYGKNKVTFNSNGGTSWTSSNGTSACNGTTSCEKQVTNNKKYGTLPIPFKNGYTFVGWYTSISGGTKITENSIVNISSDQELYARWERNTCVVTLNPNGGSLNANTSFNVLCGDEFRNATPTISSVPAASKTGNNLSGWYTTTNGGTKLSLSTIIENDITYYANWSTINYTVGISVIGGTSSASSLTIPYNTSSTASITPSSGYTLEGATISCTNNISSSLNNGTLTLKNVQNDGTCTITLNSVPQTLGEVLENDSCIGSSSLSCDYYRHTYFSCPKYIRYNNIDFIVYSTASAYNSKTKTTTLMGYKALLKTPTSKTKWCVGGLSSGNDACWGSPVSVNDSRLYTPRARSAVGSFTSDWKNIAINRSLDSYISKNIDEDLLLEIAWGGAETQYNTSSYGGTTVTNNECNTTGTVTFNFESKYGLMTYSEFVLTKSYTTLSGYYWWLLTPPSSYNKNNFYVNSSGSIDTDNLAEVNYLRPVIAVKKGVIVTSGSGTVSDPYVITSE